MKNEDEEGELIEEILAARPVGKGVAFVNDEMYEVDYNFRPPRVTKMEEEEK